MTDIEIPLGKRTAQYRFFEILPGIVSIGAIVALIVFSIFVPLAAAVLVLFIVIMMFVKAMSLAFRTIQGYSVFKKTSSIDWAKRLRDLENPKKALMRKFNKHDYDIEKHIMNLRYVSKAENEFPKPGDVLQAVFVFVYKENYDIVGPSLKAILKSNYDMKRIILIMAYEERGGEGAKETVYQVKKNFKGKFKDILTYMHPANLPDEVTGKGPNFTYAGREFTKYLEKEKISRKTS